jgi:type I restriction enzyme S subunit
LIKGSREPVNTENFGEETFLHFSIPAYDQGCLPLLEKGKTIKSTKFVVVPGSVLLSKLNPRIPRIWAPEIEGPRRAIASTEFLVLVPASVDSRTYIYQLLRSDEIRGEFTGLSLGSSTSHQRVKPDDFAQMSICLPPPHPAVVSSNVVEPAMRQIEAFKEERQSP